MKWKKKSYLDIVIVGTPTFLQWNYSKINFIQMGYI